MDLRTFLRTSLAAAVVFTTGCAADFSTVTPITGQSAVGQLQGRAFGGQQPIKGMQIYLLAASTAGYGTASGSLLTAAGSNTLLDSASGNYYVQTDANGFFGISSDYACTPGQQLYLYGAGGDPGTGTANSMIGMMAALGQCPQSGTMAQATPYIWMDEVTTVAAAYATAGFSVDPTHIAASNTAFASTGLATAFANAGNLVNLATGNAWTTTPSGTGTVPTARINTLADILATCINSSSTTDNCSQLQALTSSAAGVLASDTAAMAINIAHQPSSKATELFNRMAPQSPFQPVLSAAPADFSLTISYTGPLMTGGAKTLAVDGTNQVWIGTATPVPGNYPYGVVDEFSALGVVLSGQYGYEGSDHPQRMAFDTVGNLFYTGYEDPVDGNVGDFRALGASGVVTFSASIGSRHPSGLVTDSYNNLWTAESYLALNRYSMSGANVSLNDLYDFSYVTTNVPTGMAYDAAHDLWTANTDGTVSEITASRFVTGNPANTYYATNPTYSVGGSTTAPIVDLAFDQQGHLWEPDRVCTVGATSPFNCTVQPYAGTQIAIDGLNQAWTLVPANSSLVLQPGISGGSGLQLVTGIANESDMAVDSAGDIWIAGSTLGEVIGVAGPVRTPAVYQTAAGAGTLP